MTYYVSVIKHGPQQGNQRKTLHLYPVCSGPRGANVKLYPLEIDTPSGGQKICVHCLKLQDSGHKTVIPPSKYHGVVTRHQKAYFQAICKVCLFTETVDQTKEIKTRDHADKYLRSKGWRYVNKQVLICPNHKGGDING